MKAFAHQKVSIEHNKTTPIVFDCSDPGCVSADTEYLTPTGWKRFDKYTRGDHVAQFHPDTREIEFVLPQQYIKKPCDKMVAISPTRGTSQRLSPEHRVLYYDREGQYDVCSAQEYMDELHQRGTGSFDKKFCTTFSVRGHTTINLPLEQIRVQVAVIADGHFPNESLRCVVRLKKFRKIQRLRVLLESANITYSERMCGGDPNFFVFTFNAPRHDKEFGNYWWAASQEQLSTVASELPYWDSSISDRPSKGIRFSSFIEASAIFAQYAFSAAGHPASIAVSVRDRRNENRGVMVEYVVHAQASDKFIGPGRAESVFIVSNPEGFKYCFEVPSSFLLLRHNGYIFATGNTGKTFVRIASFNERRRQGSGALLVLAPRTLLRSVWVNDFRKFAPGLVVSVADAANRAVAFDEEADVYVTNIDAVRWIANQKPAFFKKFSDLVIDESSTVKHHTSMRSKAAAKIAKYFTHRCLMTGTPNSNSITDIWHQVYILDSGKRLGNSFHRFRDAVCVPKQVGPNANAMKWTDKEGAEESVFGLLTDIVIRHKFDDCVDIPDNHIYSFDYALTPKQMRAYLELEQTQMLTLRGKKPAVLAINAAAVATKLLQVACLSGDTEVLTNSGWKPIEQITKFDLVWDGVQWCACSGVALSGLAEIVNFEGVRMTPDHKILTLSGWVSAQEILDGNADGRFNREKVRTPDSNQTDWSQPKKKHPVGTEVRLWEECDPNRVELKEPQPPHPQVMWMQPEGNHAYCDRETRDVRYPNVQPVDQDKKSLLISLRQGLQKLWGEGYHYVRGVDRFIRDFLRGYEPLVCSGDQPRPNRQQPRVLQKQLQMEHTVGAGKQHTVQRTYLNPPGGNDGCSGGESVQPKTDNHSQKNGAGELGFATPSEKIAVYDILDVLPRHRFTVRGNSGEPFIVHNSGAVYDGMGSYQVVDNARYEMVLDLVEQRKHSLVFFLWTHQRDALIKEAERRGISFAVIDGHTSDKERADIVAAYQEGAYRTIFAHPKSAAHGLTLTRGTATIWASPTYDLEIFKQGSSRQHRIGQTEKTETIVVLAKGTLEEKVWDMLNAKDKRMTTLLDLFGTLTPEVETKRKKEKETA